MELPDWVVDEVLAPAKPVAFRLVVFLFRHGRPYVGPNGERRVGWRASLPDLSRTVGASKPHIIEAQRWLVEAGLLTVHPPTKAGASHAISAPLERVPVTNCDGPLDHYSPSRSLTSSGGGEPTDRGGAVEAGSTTTGPTTRAGARRDARSVTVRNRLEAIGVHGADEIVGRYGWRRVADVLDSVEGDGSIANPAAFTVFALRSGRRLARPGKPAAASTGRVGALHEEVARLQGEGLSRAEAVKRVLGERVPVDA